jgi:hypothetical protein
MVGMGKGSSTGGGTGVGLGFGSGLQAAIKKTKGIRIWVTFMMQLVGKPRNGSGIAERRQMPEINLNL